MLRPLHWRGVTKNNNNNVWQHSTRRTIKRSLKSGRDGCNGRWVCGMRLFACVMRWVGQCDARQALQWGEMVERVSAVMMRPYCTGVFVREKMRRNGSVSCGSYESQAIVWGTESIDAHDEYVRKTHTDHPPAKATTIFALVYRQQYKTNAFMCVILYLRV